MDHIQSWLIFITWITYVAARTEMVEPANPSVPMFVHEGGSFTLGCRNTLAKPILWKKDEQPLSTYGTRRVQMSMWVDVQFGQRVTVSSLRIPQVMAAHDQATYSCYAEGDYPRSVQVFIMALETRDAQLIGQRWERGNNEATLHCNPDQGALFEATLTWYKHGDPVAPEEGDTTTMLLDNNRTLYFRDLTYPRDVDKLGKYECVLRLPLRGRTFAKNAYVKAAAIIDDIYAEEEGDHVTIVCSGHSYPVPAVTWRKAGHMITPGTGKYGADVSENEGSGFIATLTVTNFEKEDYGNYTCLADSLLTDYEMDNMKTLLVDAGYYGEIRSVHVSDAGMVIGILIAIVVLVYLIIVLVVVFLIYRRKRRDKEKGERLEDEEEPTEHQPMLSVPEHGRQRRDTMSDVEIDTTVGVPINTLQQGQGEISDEDNTSRRTDQTPSDGSDDSIHKEKIPTSEEDSNHSPDQTAALIVPPAYPATDFEGSNRSIEDNNNEDVMDGPSEADRTSTPVKPARQSLQRQDRPPSIEDILAAERNSRSCENSPPATDSEGEEEAPPPLPPKSKSQDEYLDMTGTLGRGSKTYPRRASRNGSRKLGDSPLPKDDDSSIDGDSHVETEAVIEPKPKESQDRFDTSV